MRKLKEREAGINQCLKGRMKVRVITKVINNRTLEGYVLEVEDENFHPVVYEEKKWEDMTDQEVAELLYQFRMNNSIHENYSLLFNPKVSTEEIRSKIRQNVGNDKIKGALQRLTMLPVFSVCVEGA